MTLATWRRRGLAISRHPEGRLCLRLLALAALLPLYYASDWMLLRHALRAATTGTLWLLGQPASPLDFGSEPHLLLGGADARLFGITAHCTYADLVLTVTAFAWRFEHPRANAYRLAALAASVFIANVLRLVVAVHLYDRGLSWHQAHHLPDVAIHVGTIATAVLLALRSDRAACAMAGATADQGAGDRDRTSPRMARAGT